MSVTLRHCQVRERDLPVVIHTLAGEFDIYKEENGESIPVTCDDASNGFLKPKAGEWHGDFSKGDLVPGVTWCPQGCSSCRRSPGVLGTPGATTQRDVGLRWPRGGTAVLSPSVAVTGGCAPQPPAPRCTPCRAPRTASAS